MLAILHQTLDSIVQFALACVNTVIASCFGCKTISSCWSPYGSEQILELCVCDMTVVSCCSDPAAARPTSQVGAKMAPVALDLHSVKQYAQMPTSSAIRVIQCLPQRNTCSLYFSLQCLRHKYGVCHLVVCSVSENEWWAVGMDFS